MFLMCSALRPHLILLAICGILSVDSAGSQALNAAQTSRPTSVVRQSTHRGPSASARSALARIATEWRECGERGSGDPPVLVDCDYRAWIASDALLPRSRGNRGFRSLLSDLFDPLENRLTGGDDALAMRVVVAYSFAEFSLRRAAILTGVSRTPLARERVPYSLVSLLRRLDGTMSARFRGLLAPGVAQSWLPRWLAVRNQDCSAYPVRQCATLLDGAFRGMLYGNLTAGGEWRLPALRR
jgi:hypothetical protein